MKNSIKRISNGAENTRKEGRDILSPAEDSVVNLNHSNNIESSMMKDNDDEVPVRSKVSLLDNETLLKMTAASPNTSFTWPNSPKDHTPTKLKNTTT